MTARRAFYVNRYGQPAFAQRLSDAGITLHGITPQTGAAAVAEVLATAHVYQVTSGMHEVPHEYLVGPALLARTPQLLVVSTIGAGYDTVDLEACTQRGVVVVNQSGGANAQAVVEHTLGMMLALGKRIVEADRVMRREAGVDRSLFVGRNLHGRTLGLVGFGNVGRSLAALCSQAFGMRVLASSFHADADAMAQAGATAATLDVVMSRSDYVVVCCALSARTRGLVGAAEFARMQPHAYFITTARAGIHDEAALCAALQEGRIAGAGVDVWDEEPPPLSHALLQRDDVVATPHIAGATHESRADAAESAARQILQALAGQRPAQLRNPAVWPLYLQRLQQAFPSLAPGATQLTEEQKTT